MKKAFLNWSGGKDSAFTLWKVMQEKEFDVQSLLTTLSDEYKRISMHGVREELLDVQAGALGMELKKVFLPEMPSMEIYEEKMGEAVAGFKAEGIGYSIFGDIFLEDLKKYREDKLQGTGVSPVFPIWKMDTSKLLRDFIGAGFKAVVVCVNDEYLDKSFTGRVIDESFLNDLPGNADPCGENGEYHSFVFDGPVFKNKIKYEIGEKVHRNYKPVSSDSSGESDCHKDDKESFDTGFWYCDLLPAR